MSTTIRLRLAAVATVVAMVASGCSMNAAELPVPGSYVSGDSYAVDIEFSSVLNLPDKAKVVVDGVDAGVLDRVALKDTSAVATVDLSTDVHLPVETRAELRQSTILGEIYISLLPPETGSTSSAGPKRSANCAWKRACGTCTGSASGGISAPCSSNVTR